MEKKMFYKSDAIVFEAAKKLRRRPTRAEEILWNFLKQRPFGFKFRRQHPISNYVVDFYCYPANVAIEIDGSIHDMEEVEIWDKERQKILEEKGVKVLRFRNSEVIVSPDVVANKIVEFLRNNPRPTITPTSSTADELGQRE